MHDIRYDAVHDEIIVPVPYAQAILAFRGGADGQEAPIRVIQGPKTGTIGTRLDVDPIHNEIFTYQHNRVVVYPREGNGDVAPIRVLEGPNTQLISPYGIGVDATNNLLIVGTNSNWGIKDPQQSTYVEGSDEPGAILIFNRTDQGNVKPRAVIRGPKSGVVRTMQIQVIPGRKLFGAVMPGVIDQMEPDGAFFGVWSEDDNGDVPPLFKIRTNERTKMKKPVGVVLDPKHKEVIISDMRNQGVLVYSAPEIF